jgi:hypothetical protein
MTTSIQEMAVAIDDGYGELVAKRQELKQFKESLAPTPQAASQHEVAGRWLAEGLDLTEAARHEVLERRDQAEIQSTVHVYVTAAEAVLQQAFRSWMATHEVPLCAALQTERLAVQEGARGVLSARRPDLDRVEDLARDWSSLRREHLSLTGIKGADTTTYWRGADWVDNYVESWPEFFLAWDLEVENKEHQARIVDRKPSPFDPEFTMPNIPVGEKLTPLEQLVQLAAVDVWTPTAQQYAKRRAQLDDAAQRRRYEFKIEAKQQSTSAPSTTLPGAHITATTKPAWMKDSATPLTSRR